MSEKRILGMRVIEDESVPPGEAHIRDNETGKTVVKIVGLETRPAAAPLVEEPPRTVIAKVADDLEELSRVLGSNRAPLVRNGVEVIRTLESRLAALQRAHDRLRGIADGALRLAEEVSSAHRDRQS